MPRNRYSFTPLISQVNMQLAVVGHGYTSIFRVSERDRTSVSGASDAQLIGHGRCAGEAVDDIFCGGDRAARERHSSDLATSGWSINSINVNLAVSRASDRIVGWEVNFQSAAVRTRRDGKGNEIVSLVGCAGTLMNIVVDWEAN